MPKYHLNVKHQATTCGEFCVYQVNNDLEEDSHSLEWFKEPEAPDTQRHFERNVDYGFVWNEDGILETHKKME